MVPSSDGYPQVSVEVLCGLFGKRRQWYYKKAAVVVSESQRTKLIEEHIVYYRGLMPRIGGAKLYELVREEISLSIYRSYHK